MIGLTAKSASELDASSLADASTVSSSGRGEGEPPSDCSDCSAASTEPMLERRGRSTAACLSGPDCFLPGVRAPRRRGASVSGISGALMLIRHRGVCVWRRWWPRRTCVQPCIQGLYGNPHTRGIRIGPLTHSDGVAFFQPAGLPVIEYVFIIASPSG